MIYIIIILSIVILCLIYMVRSLFINLKRTQRHHEMFNTLFSEISDIIAYSDRRLTELDIGGAFKSDDEVGYFFNSIQELQSILNKFNSNFKPTTINE